MNVSFEPEGAGGIALNKERVIEGELDPAGRGVAGGGFDGAGVVVGEGLEMGGGTV